MTSAAVAVKDKHASPTSDKFFSESDNTVKRLETKEQFNNGVAFALKVRKPYTITKERERWTEKEHSRFLEALKLYGRAWKKIEEHVGTKTAVQIRSHAQKFFSKIFRESNNEDASDTKPIEIPPPRPKKKPMHPYPRKQVSQAKTGILMPEKLTRLESQESSTSEQENPSPVSVLSTNSSDVCARVDSSTTNGSLPPVSSTLSCTIFGLDVPKMMSDDVKKMVSDDARSQPGNKDENNDIAQEDQTGLQCFKLFGKTLIVKDSSGTFYSTLEKCKPPCLDESKENCSRPSEDAFSPVPLPWLTLCGDTPLSTRDIQNQTLNQPQLHKKENLDKNEQIEVSSSGSNTDLARDNSWYTDNLPSLVDKKVNAEKSSSFSKSSKRSLEGTEDCKKGFVPYKRHSSGQKGFVPYGRRSPEQNSAVSSTGTAVGVVTINL